MKGKIWTAAALLMAGTASAVRAQEVVDVRGVWAADRYRMAGGVEHRVEGRIFFGERDWQVLYFVLDERGEVRRGSAEGGAYTLAEGRLVFSHLFHLSSGDEMEGLPAAELRRVVREPEEAPLEPTEVRVEGDLLTLRFPSGNRMTFRRR